ncbi:hypothetical protein [Spongiactinospora sp. TRM90649]|uniref:hypothetical protein n=1 Tax=Spongiactinospora sp. TRM90649 TaxID=3031114 RepID=UPI0023F6E012|nr:hypothetical protein [Spongiactinospora sp. TRM90649]MDF5752842.1 hypothetical protein [Spongiactinospora sp. TRM90649]
MGSTIFGQPARSRLMRGLGSSIHPRDVAYDAFREVYWVAPAEAAWACRTLAARHYVSGEWSTGAVALRLGDGGHAPGPPGPTAGPRASCTGDGGPSFLTGRTTTRKAGMKAPSDPIA